MRHAHIIHAKASQIASHHCAAGQGSKRKRAGRSTRHSLQLTRSRLVLRRRELQTVSWTDVNFIPRASARICSCLSRSAWQALIRCFSSPVPPAPLSWNEEHRKPRMRRLCLDRLESSGIRCQKPVLARIMGRATSMQYANWPWEASTYILFPGYMVTSSTW